MPDKIQVKAPSTNMDDSKAPLYGNGKLKGVTAQSSKSDPEIRNKMY